MSGFNEPIGDVKEEGLGRRPAGEYRAKVIASALSNNNSDYVNITFKFVPLDNDKDDFERKVSFYIGNDKQYQGLRSRTKNFLIAFGCITNDGVINFNANDNYQSVIGKSGRAILQHHEWYNHETGTMALALKPLDFGAFYNENRQSALEITNKEPAERINKALEESQKIRKMSAKDRKKNGLPEEGAEQTPAPQNESATDADITSDMPF